MSGVSQRSENIRRILIVRTDRLGDVVLTLPLLPALRRCFPDAHIAMLLKHYTGEILEGNPFVDEVIWYDEGGTPVPFRTMCRFLRRKEFDAAVVVYPRHRLAWLMACAGIPVRVGTGYRYYSFLFNRRVYEHRSDARKHEVEYNFGLLEKIGCFANGKVEFPITIPEQARLSVDHILESSGCCRDRPYMVVHPGSGGSAREWSPENFAIVASRVRTSAGIQIVITGGPGEERKVEAVLRAMGGQALPLVGRLTLRELAALLERASLMIANSTGPLHLAASVGTAVIGLYPQHTAMSATRWGPWTSRKEVFVPGKPTDCMDCLKPGVTGCACMDSINAEVVYEAAMRLLEREVDITRTSQRNRKFP